MFRARKIAIAFVATAAAVSVTVIGADAAFAADTITTPKLTAPTLTAPTLSTPTLTAPTLSTPQLSVPQLSVPQLTAPQLTTPQMPTLQAPAAPTLAVPTLTAPTLAAPQMPTLVVPTLQLPTIPGTQAADIAKVGSYGLSVVVTLPTNGGAPAVGAVDKSAVVRFAVPVKLGKTPGKAGMVQVGLGNAYALTVTGLAKGTHTASVLTGGSWAKFGTVKSNGKKAELPAFSAGSAGTYLVKIGKGGKARYLAIVVS